MLESSYYLTECVTFIWGWSCQFALNSYNVASALRLLENHAFFRIISQIKYKSNAAAVAELADAQDLKSCVLGRAGSSPASRTK